MIHIQSKLVFYAIDLLAKKSTFDKRGCSLLTIFVGYFVARRAFVLETIVSTSIIPVLHAFSEGFRALL